MYNQSKCGMVNGQIVAYSNNNILFSNMKKDTCFNMNKPQKAYANAK